MNKEGIEFKLQDKPTMLYAFAPHDSSIETVAMGKINYGLWCRMEVQRINRANSERRAETVWSGENRIGVRARLFVPIHNNKKW